LNASSNGRAEVVRILLAAGADVHANNDAAIYWAALGGHVEVVRLLLAAGADVHADRENALRRAAGSGHVQMVRLLLDAGADPTLAWTTTDPVYKNKTAETPDACADVMTTNQRTELAKKSNYFVRLRAEVAASSRRQRLHR